jgi:Domain of unknown function (DUF4440)
MMINSVSRTLILPLVLSSSLLISMPVLAETVDDDAALTQAISTLDTKVFDAYNSCNLKTFGSYFSPKVEFYHDKGGATFDRKTVVANTQKYICHKVRRELIPASLKVYPIKDYGAIEEGEHRFCQSESGQCEGIAKFLIVWKQKGETWTITRVLSYGHRAL